MSKTPPQLADERGFFTLPVPKPGLFDVLHNYRAYRWLAHRLLYLRLRFAHGGKLLVVAGAGVLGLVTLGLLVGFFVPQTLALSFGSENCLFNPQLFPKLTEHQASDTFTASSKPFLSVAGQPLVSFQTCVHANAAPEPGSVDRLQLAPFGNPLLKKQITVKTGALPAPSVQFDTAQAVGTGSSLNFNLDQADRIFSYQLTSGDLAADCSTNASQVTCPLKPLSLKPGTNYELSLARQFKGSGNDKVLAANITTLDPVIVTSASIADGSIVYDNPRQLTLALNKPLQPERGQASLIKTGDNTSVNDVTNEVNGNAMTISFPELARQQAYRLELTDLVAEDSSMLERPYILNFTMSGGPKVVSTSIGSFKVSTSSSVAVNFDVGLAPEQDFAKFASIETSSGAVAARVTLSGSQLTINPNGDLPRCTPFTVKIFAGLINQYGIGGGEAWQYSSKTICQIAYSIGKSVNGRSITAYRFGSGSSKVIFVGGMHGNEKSSVATLNGWIDYLEHNAHKLPANRSVIVIPNHNPDGYVSSRRTNLNNVDLNRNFPSNDWATGIHMPGNLYLPNGGGISPLDQPESAALASFIQNENPRLVLTYHAVAKVVISNDAGDSVALAQKYASESGYPFTSNANSGGTFEYATTGEFEDWLADKEGVPGILVELSSMSANQINTHRSAMWAMATLP